MEQAFQELRERLVTVVDLSHVEGLLSWDQETYMPPKAAQERAQQIATVTRIAHETLIHPRVGELLEQLTPWVATLPDDSFEASLVRATRRHHRQAIRVPSELVARLAEAQSLALTAWRQARERKDFSHFAPALERVVSLTREQADHLRTTLPDGTPQSRYDALLDLYEPDLTTARIRPLFDELRAALVPMVEAISRRADAVDDRVLHQEFAEEGLWALGMEVLEAMGYDFEAGRQDHSAHPFTIGLGLHDVRLTTRLDRRDLGYGLYSTIHEGGHALYDQGVNPAYQRTFLAGAASLGIHESQSRLWENVVGRSREFWRFFLPRAQARFPAQLGHVDVETIYRAVNRVQRSEIRTEADEVTYHLHIFLRFELEQALIEGDLAIADLPGAWDDRMEAYLGLRPSDVSRGVLQDIHWAFGHIGYFPTYTLGSVLAVQFYEQACREVPDIPAAVAQGELAPLREWLREHIHRWGNALTPEELVRRVTGGPIQAAPFLRYLQRKYGELYGL